METDVSDWTAIGPRFSNSILQTLLVLLRKRPPKNRRLLIIGTTSERSILKQMDFMNSFDAEIPVPTVPSLRELDEILKSVNVFDSQTRKTVLQELESMNPTGEVKVGIKRILSILETSMQDEDAPGRFVSLLVEGIGASYAGEI
jgi:vesicle-fusing ATPase